MLIGPTVAPAQEANLPQPANRPCDSPECRQFDFWVGDWEVDTPDGKRAGTNRVEKILDGCVLLENWSGARGGAGKSFNLYSATEKRWRQIWVDNRGMLLELAGGIEDGKMVLQDARPGTVRNRITWEKLADGRVRQHWTTSQDDGVTWTDAFVGFYKLKAKP